MKKTLTDCNPTILDQSIIMTGEYEFMNKNDIKERCKCNCKSVCLQIADLLDNDHRPEALDLLGEIKNK